MMEPGWLAVGWKIQAPACPRICFCGGLPALDGLEKVPGQVLEQAQVLHRPQLTRAAKGPYNSHKTDGGQVSVRLNSRAGHWVVQAGHGGVRPTHVAQTGLGGP